MAIKDIRSLHKPISPIDASAYNALCTVVQAFPLAVLFFVVSKNEIYDNFLHAIDKGNWSMVRWDRILKILLVIGTVAVVWHRYVLDNNFTCWRLTWRDTVIPFLFALLQCCLALAISHSPAAFEGCLCLITGLACWSYSHCLGNLRNPHAKMLFLKHFEDDGEVIYNTIDAYFAKSLMSVSLCTGITGVIWVLCVAGYLSKSPYLDFFVVFVTSAVIISYQFLADSGAAMSKYYDPAQYEVKPSQPAVEIVN